MTYIPFTLKRTWLPQDTAEADDWNRIEANLSALAEAAGIAQTAQEWTPASFPTVARINNIKSRINALCAVYGVETLPVSSANLQRFSYRDMQRIEDALQDIYDKAVIA